MKTKGTLCIFVSTLLIFVTVSSVTGTEMKNTAPSSSELGVEWTQTIGGDLIDWGNCIKQTSDGGYIVTGTYDRSYWYPWNGFFYLLKTDTSGVEEWNIKLGGDMEYNGECVQQTSDGGYIVAGYVGYGATLDGGLFKADADGNVIWMYNYGGEEYDVFYGVLQTSDGGYIAMGSSASYSLDGNHDVWLLKTDADGIEEWSQTFGGSEYDHGQSIQHTSDGGYIITGDTETFGSGMSDVYLVKTDANGVEEWSQTFGGTGWDSGYSVQQTTDNGYIITGYTEESGNNNVYLVKTDSSGNEEWSQTFGGDEYDEGYSVQQTTDGGYILTGYYTDSVDFTMNLCLIKTDASGNEEWSQILGEGNGGDEVGNCICPTSDGGYIITGYTGSWMAANVDVWLIKLEGMNQNQPPSTPDIDGQTSGKPGQSYDYTLTAIDPDGDDVKYVIDWDDGDSESTEFVASGAGIAVSHVWTEKGTYIVKVKAKDTSDAESDWATLEVTMPRNKNLDSTLFFRLLERFPNIFSVLRHILGL